MSNQDYYNFMKDQPVINIGMIGHVSDGKSTIIKSLTGIITQKHSQEKIKNITIKLGYANAKIAKCNVCNAPECYASFRSSEYNYICKYCNNKMTLINHVSFVDCPGHNQLLSTMINGTSVMDYTLLIESVANKIIPAPQTIEHLLLINKLKIKNIATIINKIDLCKPDRVYECIDDYNKFCNKSNLNTNMIVPISATFGINMDILCEILGNLEIPKRNIDSKVKLIIIRSFNINKPDTQIDDIKGGVVGGTIIEGQIKVNDELLLLSPIIINNKYKPLTCKVVSINSDVNKLDKAISGGLLGIMLDIDPALSSDNNLVGNVLINKDFTDYVITQNFNIILIDINNNIFDINKTYIVNINSNILNCKITQLDREENKEINIRLDKPIYIEKQDKVIISEDKNGLHIVGYGYITTSINLEKYVD
jgi:translation initiation factor 2 subunit 3